MNTPRTDAAWNATFDGEQMSAGRTARALRECSQRLETELSVERARLNSGQILLTVAGERVWHSGVDLRAAIDAAMKEGAK